ncbi:MAG: adenosylcobinamide-GDP ribazoletransferase [Mycobacteriales bacterium]
MTLLPTRINGEVHELLASIGVLTVLPVARTPVRRSSILVFAPLVGFLLGGLAAAVAATGDWLYPGAVGALLAGTLSVGVLALLTRGLHLDGLADTADGLGRLGGADASLAVMRQPDIGPFGVITLVLVIMIDSVALARCIVLGRGPASVVAAVVTGRLAMVHSAVPGIVAARTEGLGAWVAESVPRGRAWCLTAVTAGLLVLPLVFGAVPLAVRLAGALAGGLATGSLVRRRSTARFGGITGDVLGAVCEASTTAALCVCAIF